MNVVSKQGIMMLVEAVDITNALLDTMMVGKLKKMPLDLASCPPFIPLRYLPLP